MTTTLKLRQIVRRTVSAPVSTPVEVVPGDAAPALLGESYRWETRGGQLVRHPTAYRRRGWSSIVYIPSTRRIEVGEAWLQAHAS